MLKGQQYKVAGLILSGSKDKDSGEDRIDGVVDSG